MTVYEELFANPLQFRLAQYLPAILLRWQTATLVNNGLDWEGNVTLWIFVRLCLIVNIL